METIADNIAAADNDALMKTMPENYVFPGFLVFALLGPIVHPDMRRYQSHLIMTRPPIGNDAGGQSSAVSSSKRKRAGAKNKITMNDAASISKVSNTNVKVEVKQEQGSSTYTTIICRLQKTYATRSTNNFKLLQWLNPKG
jgi:hypothetical protein